MTNQRNGSLYQNVESVQNILKDISQKLTHQVLSNCDTLEQIEIGELISFVKNALEKDDKSDKTGEKIFQAIKSFRRQNTEALIKSPLRQQLARLNGLDRVLVDIKNNA